MSSVPFLSHAPNREDVVLHRALPPAAGGRFLDVGVRGPLDRSVTHGLSGAGWAGTLVTVGEPAQPTDGSRAVVRSIPALTPDHLRDAVADVQASPLHLLVLDAPVRDRDALLQALDLPARRPSIVVLRDGSTDRPLLQPDAAEAAAMVEQGYEPCLFDGISRFFVDRERAGQLAAALSIPATAADDAVSAEVDELRRDLQEAQAARQAAEDRAAAAAALVTRHDEEQLAALLEWRRFATSAWSRAATAGRGAEVSTLRRQVDLNFNHITTIDAEIARLRQERDALQRTLSWRVTAPLRRVRTVTRRKAR